MTHKLFGFRRFAAILPLWTALGLAQSPVIPPADPARYKADVTVLAAPNMEGRGAGTKGLTRAQKYIVSRYKSLGLEPAGSNGYLQPFTVPIRRKLLSGNRLHEEFASSAVSAGKPPKLGEDYTPLTFSSSKHVLAPVVFAGYGISAPEYNYDDYAGRDVADKIVLIFRGEPDAVGAKGDHGHTKHAALITKLINAKSHGAAAVIFVNSKLGKDEQDLLPKFGEIDGPEDSGVAAVQVKRAIAERWVHTAGRTLDSMQDDLDAAAKTPSAPKPPSSTAPLLLQRVALDVNLETVRAQVANVLAYLPGKTDEYVIVGAHYDHLGRGGSHSLAPSQTGTFHPGADDNASGSAGVLELARLFAPHKGELKRGILFMNFAGEELGLLGSDDWVQHPTRPLPKAVAMLNMDMIGRIQNDKVFIGGVGTGTTLRSALDHAKGDSRFNLELSDGGYASSDHTSFVSKKIPVLFFFSGLHADYHKPSDTADKINAESAAKLLNIVARVDEELADAADRPGFVVVQEKTQAGGVSSGGGYGPWFGSIPDFGQNEKGVKFSDVRPGSPAAKAGLKGGDIMIQFGDRKIDNLYDFTDALQRHKVGDVLDVTVLRDGKPLTVSVKLEQRR